MPNEYSINGAAKSDMQPVEGIVTYTGRLLLKEKTAGRDALIYIAFMLVLCLAAPFVLVGTPGPHAGYWAIAEGFGWMCAFPVLLISIATIPWQLTLNYGAQTYTSTFGYSLINFRHSGPFVDISGVSAVASPGMYDKFKHLVILRFARGPIPRKMCIEMGLVANEAIARAQQLATAIGTSVVDSGGQHINIDSPASISSDHAEYSQASTKYGRKVYRQSIIGIVFMTLVFASIYPLFVLTSPGGAAKGIEMLILFVFFY